MLDVLNVFFKIRSFLQFAQRSTKYVPNCLDSKIHIKHHIFENFQALFNLLCITLTLHHVLAAVSTSNTSSTMLNIETKHKDLTEPTTKATRQLQKPRRKLRLKLEQNWYLQMSKPHVKISRHCSVKSHQISTPQPVPLHRAAEFSES